MITLKQLRNKLGPQCERIANPQDLNDALLAVRLEDACKHALEVLNREPTYTVKHFKELHDKFRDQFRNL